MDRSTLDRAFGVGVLVVAAIAILELQFANFIYGQAQTAFDDRWTQIVFVFRVTAIPLFILVIVWLVAMAFPHVRVPIVRRRYLKEFCWALLGNVLVLNFATFNFLSAINYYPPGGHIALEVDQKVLTGMLISFFLTFLATWSYRRVDLSDKEISLKFGLVTILEHALVYVVSYFLILSVVWSSGFFLM